MVQTDLNVRHVLVSWGTFSDVAAYLISLVVCLADNIMYCILYIGMTADSEVKSLTARKKGS